MKHKGIDAINKSAFAMLEHSKNIVKQNVATMVARGDLKIDRAVLPNLLQLINASIDQGFHSYSKTFANDVEKAFVSASEPVSKKK